MTQSGSGAPDRSGSDAGTASSGTARGTIVAIAVVLALGLAFRLILAYLMPGSGFRNDVEAFRIWAAELARLGLAGFYDRPFFLDYTPGYLYVLALVGEIGAVLGGVGDLIKVPAILGDIALAAVAAVLVHDLGGGLNRARLAAFVVVVNPVTWFDSVVWGQVDSFGLVFLLLAIRELWKGRTERSASLAVTAALIKPQLGILAPIVAAVTIRRALWPSGAFGSDPEPSPSGTGWERRTRGPIRILTTGIAGFLTAVVIAAPFGMSVIELTGRPPFVDSDLVRQIFSTAAGYPYITVNAFNPWALATVDHGGFTWGITTGSWICDTLGPAIVEGGPSYACSITNDPAVFRLLGIPAVFVGGALLMAALVGVSVVVARRPDRRTILVGTFVLALAFFVLPTRVHERYIFPAVALGTVLAVVSWRWAIVYVVVSAATLINMYVVLTTIYRNNPGIADWLGVGPPLRTFPVIAMVALATAVALGWALLQLRHRANTRLAHEISAAGAGDDGLEASWDDGPEPEGAAIDVGAAPLLPLAAPPEALTPARAAPAWYERPTAAVLGPFEWIRARVGETPLRPDRTRTLAAERGGRFDRLDVWLLVVLVVATLALRTFRLAEPLQMHFDEVYHPRTSAEFLQLWRYGETHTIYEWTHPHLAKYAMAAGIVAFAGHDVEATSELGVPVRDAAVEPRRTSLDGSRAGERLWVATGSELVAFDLRDRGVVARWALPGVSAVAVDANARELLVGDDAGTISRLDLAVLDDNLPVDAAQPGIGPVPVTTIEGTRIRQLFAPDGIATAVARLDADGVATVDLETGAVRRVVVPGAIDLAPGGSSRSVVATVEDVVDGPALAADLAEILGGDEATYAERIAAASPGDVVILAPEPSGSVQTELTTAIGASDLPGVSIQDVTRVAVAGADGVSLLDTKGLLAETVGLPGGASGLAYVTGVENYAELYVAGQDEAGDPRMTVLAVSGSRASSGPVETASVPMPGTVSRVIYDPATELVHVLGTAPDGAGDTIYVIEPHARAVFADHRLPEPPAAWALDTAPQYPAADRSAILAFAPDGAAASVDVGHYAFAWRLPGVIAGAVTAALLYVLARILFARRSIAVLAGLFVLLDGMMFVQSRIGMNDVYVGVFIIAAYTVFAAIWAGRFPGWQAFALGMPAIGLLLGLALASKWVAAYAIGALGILILARSALGRVILVAGLIGITATLGWMAMAVGPEGGLGNLTFVVIMVAITLSAVVVCVLHPIAWSLDEIRFAVGAPAVLGLLVALGSVATGRAGTEMAVGPFIFTPIQVAFAFVLLAVVVAGAFVVLGRLGIGPFAPLPRPDDPASLVEPAAPSPEGWLRLGAGFGLPAVWIAACLVALPLVVYVVSYIPWAFVDAHQLVTGWPAGHDGQTLAQLTGEMYRYHNQLDSGHAASSPWWAWPLNLKPVWFYQGGYANGTAGAVYDAGNLVIWWLGIPAMVFVAWSAYRRRNLGLALILIGFLCQWIPWARIDRASFQYHYYTSLPFVILALAYFVAEVWHGASRVTWLVARIAAAIAILGPAILWLLRTPLCGFVDVNRANPGSQACTGNPGNLEITPAAGGIALVGIVIGLVLLKLLADLAQPRADGRSRGLRDLVPLGIVAAIGGAGFAVANGLPTDRTLIAVPALIPEVIALLVGAPLVLVAAQVITARDARRAAIGIALAAAAWFAVLYPNISALPLPTTLVNSYQGLLPTYLYPFQFPVTQRRVGTVSFSDERFIVLALAVAFAAIVIAYAAWVWRIALAERRAGRTGGPPGPEVAAGEA